MAPFMKEVKFAVLSANIRPDRSLAATFGASCLPYKIFTVGGEKVGVVGYTSQETPALSRPGESRLVQSRLLWWWSGAGGGGGGGGAVVKSRLLIFCFRSTSGV